MLRRKYRKIYYFFNTYNKEFDNGKSIKYNTKFIDNYRFMLTSLSNFLSERLHSNKYMDCKSHLDYMSVNNQLIFRSFECKQIIRKTLMKI